LLKIGKTETSLRMEIILSVLQQVLLALEHCNSNQREKLKAKLPCKENSPNDGGGDE